MSTKNSPDASASGDSAPSRMRTGIEGLDDILQGGFPAHRVYLVEGEPGTGKTTLALQFLMEGVRGGEAGLYVTLSETKEELKASAHSHGWSLDGIDIHELVPAEDTLKPESQYTIFHPSEIELSETTSAVLKEVERINPRRVVFDSLSEVRLLARDPLRYRRQMLALKQYFIGRQCTVLLLDDMTSTVRDMQLQSIVHGVLSLEQLAVEYGAERRRLRVVKLRGSRFRGGYHDFNIETGGGVVVFPRLVAAEHQQEFAKGNATSNVPELDALLGGGLARGSSTLIIGPAGSGKSTLGAQFAAAAALRGEKSAVFVFDEIVETYIGRAAGIGTNIQQHLDDKLTTLKQIDPAELAPGEFAHRVLRAVDRDGVRLVIIDSLNGYLNAMPEEHFLTIQMHELLTFLNQRGIVTILVMAQHGFLGTMASPVDVSYLADTVLMLRYFEAEGAVHRALSVIKKRSGAHENTIRELEITSQGIRVGEPLAKFRGVLTGVPVYGKVKNKILDESDDHG